MASERGNRTDGYDEGKLRIRRGRGGLDRGGDGIVEPAAYNDDGNNKEEEEEEEIAEDNVINDDVVDG